MAALKQKHTQLLNNASSFQPGYFPSEFAMLKSSLILLDATCALQDEETVSRKIN